MIYNCAIVNMQIFCHFQFSHTYIGGSYVFETVLSEYKVVTKVTV